MKKEKYDRIKVVEDHTMWNSRVIFALFCLILLFGIVTGIRFWQQKERLSKMGGEWECAEEYASQWRCVVEIKLIGDGRIIGRVYEPAILGDGNEDRLILKPQNNCQAITDYQCTKYQYVRYSG